MPGFGKYVVYYWNTAYGLGGCGSANEGDIKGTVSNKVYVCENNVWLEARYREKYCFENECKYFVDSRDNQRYAYVVIGEQTWMADNLNYNIKNSKCYDDLDSNCDIYGRLYDWETALTVCPYGWHLPTNEEWKVMTDYIGERTAGAKLKATSGWHNNGNGTDEYGFSALPGGGFEGVGLDGYWWSANLEYDGSDIASCLYMRYRDDYANFCNYSGGALLSVRCLQD